MQTIITIEIGTLIAVSLLLLWAAITDVKYRRIPNKIVLSIFGLFILWATLHLSKDVDFYGTIFWPLVTAFIVLAVGAGLFAMRLMGGGDVKLLAVMALFAGPVLSFPFVLYVALSGGILALVTLLHTRMKQSVSDTPPKVPYGVAIMAGGVWVCLQKFSTLSV